MHIENSDGFTLQFNEGLSIMRFSIYLILTVILSSSAGFCAEGKAEYFESIKGIEASDERISIYVDLMTNKIILTKFELNSEIPIGTLSLQFPKKYTVPISKKSVSESGKIKLEGSDYYDGIGTTIEISYYEDIPKATIKINSQFEELNLYYAPQLVPVTILKR